MNLRVSGILLCHFRNESHGDLIHRIASLVIVAIGVGAAVVASATKGSAQSGPLATTAPNALPLHHPLSLDVHPAGGGGEPAMGVAGRRSGEAAAPANSAPSLRSETLPRFIWDFGRGDDTNFDDWPDGWQRRVGRRYPKYVKIGIVAKDLEAQRQWLAIDTMVIRVWPQVRKWFPAAPTLPPSFADAMTDRYLKVEL
ncbi:MAG: hypothetical protein ACF788_07225, partial [Novipirellula sp. JB048]